MSYPTLMLPDLNLLGVMDPNVPDSERVVLRPNRQTNLVGVGIAVGLKTSEAGGITIHDNVFWFPEILVEPPAWIFVYTGRGQTRQTTMPIVGEPALVYHWQRRYTIFAQPELVPILFRAYSIIVGHQFPRSTG